MVSKYPLKSGREIDELKAQVIVDFSLRGNGMLKYARKEDTRPRRRFRWYSGKLIKAGL